MSDGSSTVTRMRPPPRSRKRKACERCFRRKQRCDGKEPTCQNCATSGNQCVPAARDAMGVYPVRYISSLETQVAELQGQRKEREQPHSQSLSDTIGPSLSTATGPLQPGFPSLSLLASPSTIPMEDISLSPTPGLHGAPNDDSFMPDFNFLGHLQTSIVGQSPSISPPAALALNVVGTPELNSPSRPKPISLSVVDAASHFLTYVEIIHPRYPFLEVEDCSLAYLAWRDSQEQAQGAQNSWHLFLATMVCTFMDDNPGSYTYIQ